MSTLLCSTRKRFKITQKGAGQSNAQRQKVYNRLMMLSHIYGDVGTVKKGVFKNLEDAMVNDGTLFEEVFYSATGKELNPEANPITMSDVRKFERRLHQLDANFTNAPTKLEAFLKLPKAILRRIPALKEFENELIQESSFFRRESFASTKKVNGVLTNFKLLAKTMSTDIKKIDKLENGIRKASENGDPVLVNQLLKERNEFLLTGGSGAY